MRSLVMSIFIYACGSWTLTADTERRIQALEMRCLRKLLGITYRDHISNEEVRNRTWQANGPHEDLLTTVKRRKLKWYRHVTRSTGLAKTILHGTEVVYFVFFNHLYEWNSSADKRKVLIGYKCRIAHAQRYTSGAIYDVAL